jgi:Na+-transporting NADH:ubiquinone oxidoreductase subunit C
MAVSGEKGMKLKGNRVFSVFYMFLIMLVFTSAVTGIYAFNERRIEINDRLKLQKVILDVLNIEIPEGASDEEVVQIFDRRVETKEWEGKTIYVARDEGGAVVGYAFHLQGNGFWGPVYGMIGVNPELDKVLDIAFYKHTETPGLGGRISEEWFTDKFEGKPIRDVESGELYFDFRPPGTAEEPHQIDAITGASGTSYAVERFMNENLRNTLPVIQANKA